MFLRGVSLRDDKGVVVDDVVNRNLLGVAEDAAAAGDWGTDEDVDDLRPPIGVVASTEERRSCGPSRPRDGSPDRWSGVPTEAAADAEAVSAIWVFFFGVLNPNVTDSN